MNGRRAQRVAETIRAYVTEALLRDLGDALLARFVITEVDVNDDLAVAHVSVRLLIGDEDPKLRHDALRRLHRASARLRRGLAPRLKLRRLPELRFKYDAGLDATRRVEAILQEIAVEPKGEPPDDSES